MTSTKVLFFHGAPAVGKLTVARALANRCSAALIDNHVVIDFAKSVLPFGADGFFDLVRAGRLLALQYATRYRLPLVIYTSCYSDPEDRPQLEAIEEILRNEGGTLFPVYLTCSCDAQHLRVGQADRKARGKLTTVESLRNFEKQWNFVPVPREHCLELDTTNLAPEEAAQFIVNHFALGG